MINYQVLKVLYSSKSISRLSGNPKKSYKNGLVMIFVASLMVGNEQKKQHTLLENMQFCEGILAFPKLYLAEEHSKEIEKIVQGQLKNLFVKDPSTKKTADTIIELMRKAIDHKLKGKRYLLKFEELDRIIDLKLLFSHIQKNFNPNMSNHHWIEFDLKQGLVPSFPDFLTYANLVSLWNMFLDKQEELKIEQIEQVFNKDMKKLRLLNSELQALFISSWIQGVTFVESYIYYVFYNIQKGEYPLKTEKAKGFIKSQLPDDNQIIDKLIIPEFKTEHNKSDIANIKKLHKSYKTLNQTRNRLIHASAFEESDSSHLLPLINSNYNDLPSVLETCTDLVLAIEKVLPSDLKMLFWWDAMDHPIYKDLEKGNFVKRDDISI
ncbi:hypothetical protein [Bacillus mesophilum]|uniref:Uncharacterized protein n=1 Tax=Bacillus mesophilum TaxID=1071718 RepID=A0A7V7RHZ5_9BACI|nr:hypothetical protein [Bacillus mesophilum]KAB2329432.1 hypothetical protein F7732_21135 [Bacillus mesophilum]